MISDCERGLEVTPKSIDLFIAMRLLDISWENVTQNTIKNCFRKALFNFDKTSESITTIEVSSEENVDIWNRLKELTSIPYKTFEDYINCDDIEYIDEILSEEEIIQEIYAKTPETVD